MFSFSFYYGVGGLLLFLVFLILIVCGAAFGIALLINYVRLTGVEIFSLSY
jgi:hypothetical protein